jgi:hypothetical protein
MESLLVVNGTALKELPPVLLINRLHRWVGSNFSLFISAQSSQGQVFEFLARLGKLVENLSHSIPG